MLLFGFYPRNTYHQSLVIFYYVKYLRIIFSRLSSIELVDVILHSTYLHTNFSQKLLIFPIFLFLTHKNRHPSKELPFKTPTRLYDLKEWRPVGKVRLCLTGNTSRDARSFQGTNFIFDLVLRGGKRGAIQMGSHRKQRGGGLPSLPTRHKISVGKQTTSITTDSTREASLMIRSRHNVDPP